MDYSTLIIGGGVHGLSTAYHLNRLSASRLGTSRRGASRLSGKKIALVEQFKIGHNHGSSHGPSRITRSAYAYVDYVRLMQHCYQEEWPRLEQETGQKLIHKTPGCFFGPKEGKKFKSYTQAVLEAKADVELIDLKKGKKLFPQFQFQNSPGILLDHTAGIVAADRVIEGLHKIVKKSAIDILEETKILEIDFSKDPIILKTNKGSLSTERLVVTAGAWVAELLPFLKSRLKVARQTVGYFQFKEEDKKFEVGRFPAWVYLDDDPQNFLYGLPKFGIDGIKIARHITKDRDDDPNLINGPIDSKEIDSLTHFISKFFITPLEKIVRTEHCLYTCTATEDFIIDFHPDNKNILIGSICSGHGFKFGPLTGRILAELILNGKTTIPDFEAVKKRFSF